MKKKYETMFDVNEMKNAWKMMYVFPPIPIFICQQLFFCLSSNLFLEIQYQLNYIICYLLSPITSTTYIDANPIKKTKARKKFLKIKKTTTVAWNCLCFTLIYYQSSFMLLRTTIYWQIGIKKLRSVFSTKIALPIIVYIHYSDG